MKKKQKKSELKSEMIQKRLLDTGAFASGD